MIMKRKRKALLVLSASILLATPLISCGSEANTVYVPVNPIDNRKVTNIELSGAYKTVYLLNEELDLTGLVVTIYYDDGSSEVIDSSKYDVIGSTSRLGKAVVTISYKGEIASFTIEVKESVDPDPDPDPQGHDDDDPDKGLGTVDRPFSPTEACELAKTLGSDEQTPICYFIKGKAADINDSGTAQYGNISFNLSDGTANKFYCFQVCYLDKQKFTTTGTIKAGDDVTIFSAIVNYKGNTPETTNKGTAYVYEHNGKKSSTVPEQGYATPDPSATVTTISNLISSNSSWKTEGANSSKLYRITGIVQYPDEPNYGNFDILDSTGYIYVHGLTRSKKGLVNDGENGKVIDNDKSFASIGLVPGDEVTIEGWYAYHAYTNKYGISQFTGYVTNVKKNKTSYYPSSFNYDSSTEESNNYYSSVDSLTGNDLLKGLHNLMDSTHTNYISYSSLDGYYNTSDKYGSNGVKCFYSGEKTSSYNKEHVWPQSLSGTKKNHLYGESGGGSDLHHVRPTISNYNSARSSAMFGNLYASGTYKGRSFGYEGGGTTYYVTNVFEPADNIKGDVARIIMYMYMHYNDGTISDLSSLTGWKTKTGVYGEMHINWVMGPGTVKESFKLLRYWNYLDPVDAGEKARNEKAYSVQGNRNPFIDHPSYADKIWG